MVKALSDLGQSLVSYENLLADKAAKNASFFNRLFNLSGGGGAGGHEGGGNVVTVERGEKIRGLYIW